MKQPESVEFSAKIKYDDGTMSPTTWHIMFTKEFLLSTEKADKVFLERIEAFAKELKHELLQEESQPQA